MERRAFWKERVCGVTWCYKGLWRLDLHAACGNKVLPQIECYACRPAQPIPTTKSNYLGGGTYLNVRQPGWGIKIGVTRSQITYVALFEWWEEKSGGKVAHYQRRHNVSSTTIASSSLIEV